MTAALLQDFLKNAKEKEYCVNYVQVRQGGRTIAAFDRIPSRTRLNVWSVSKSVVAMAFSLAMADGYIGSPEDFLLDYFPAYAPKEPNENLRQVRLKHLLTMTTGLADPLFFGDSPERYVTPDWIAYFFEKGRFIHTPGTEFLYSNFNTYLLSCIIERAAGCNLLYYLRDRFFAPLGIYSPDWTLCPKGHVYAANGLYLNIDELSNFGEMLLGGGKFRGKQIIDANWVEICGRKHVDTPAPNHGYGYQFWRNPDQKGYHAMGGFGQFCILLPERDAVVSVMSLDTVSINPDYFDLVWNEIACKL